MNSCRMRCWSTTSCPRRITVKLMLESPKALYRMNGANSGTPPGTSRITSRPALIVISSTRVRSLSQGGVPPRHVLHVPLLTGAELHEVARADLAGGQNVDAGEEVGQGVLQGQADRQAPA